MRPGTYVQDMLLANSGTSASPITGAYPGERVEVGDWFKTAGAYIVLEGFDSAYFPNHFSTLLMNEPLMRLMPSLLKQNNRRNRGI